MTLLSTPETAVCINVANHHKIFAHIPRINAIGIDVVSGHTESFAMSTVGIDVVSVHTLFAYRVVSTVSTDIVSSHTKYCRLAYGITR